MMVAAVPAFTSPRGATGGDVHIRVTDCSQAQGAAVRQTQRGDARGHRGSSAVEISQKGHVKQVNACRHGKAAGGDIRLRQSGRKPYEGREPDGSPARAARSLTQAVVVELVEQLADIALRLEAAEKPAGE